MLRLRPLDRGAGLGEFAPMRWGVYFACLVAAPLWAGDLPKPGAEFVTPDRAQAELGQVLFYDPILSGSKTVSCAHCHHPRFGTGDGVSLGLGDGGIGLGPERRADPDNPPQKRMARNAPGLFNLGAVEFTRLFHDGRVERDPTRPSGLRTPLGEGIERGDSSLLAAQLMFPLLSPDEMAGHFSESDVSAAIQTGRLTGPGGALSILTARIETIPAYRRRFDLVIGPRAIRFTDIANALAAFVALEWRADDSAFDRHLQGRGDLPPPAQRGMGLFYGSAACSECHAGLFQTDHDFHAIAMPQIGPGKPARFEIHTRDMGRMRVTNDPADAYRFRTPSLRNVVHTGPYGHAGAFGTLDGVIRHHLDPVTSLYAYDPDQAILPGPGFETDLLARAIPADLEDLARANELLPRVLTDAEVADLIAFLHALSDETSLTGRLGVPVSVPSGLDVAQ